MAAAERLRPTRGCQEGDEGIPWNRAEDRDTSSKFPSVFVLALTSIVLLLVGLGLGQAPAARRVQIAGLASTFASTLVVALLWL